jgi:hypothetical protein
MDTNLEQGNSFLGSLLPRPGVRFDVQHRDEEVLLLIRKHPATQIPWLVNATGIFLIVIILNFIVSTILNITEILFLNIFGFVLIYFYVWINFLKWYFNVGLITNERVLDIDFKNVLYKEVNIARLDNIEQMSSKKIGYIGSIFNYGDVHVETAGAEVNIEFLRVPNPSAIVKFITDLTDNSNDGNN